MRKRVDDFVQQVRQSNSIGFHLLTAIGTKFTITLQATVFAVHKDHLSICKLLNAE